MLAVTSAQRLGFKPVEDWLEDVPARGWKRLSAGDGAKGPRLYDWAYLPYRTPPVPGWKTGLLIRRKKGRPHQFTFYLTRSPEETSLAELVRMAGQRWRIESCFEEAKGETGLDEYEVRSWTGWHRHITLSMLAHAYLTVVRRHAIGGRSLPSCRPRGCCRSPCRRCDGCSGIWCGSGRLRLRRWSTGRCGAGAISSALANVTGASAPDADVKPGCSIRPRAGSHFR